MMHLSTLSMLQAYPHAVARRPAGAAAAAVPGALGAGARLLAVRVQARAAPEGHSHHLHQGSPPASTHCHHGSTHMKRSSLTTAAAAAAAFLLPLAQPEAAAAATAAAAALLPAHGHAALASEQAYWWCMGLGATGVVTTLLFTSRFLMSYFPELERRAKAQGLPGWHRRPGILLLRALTVTDPLLDPITRGLFKMTEKGDLNYGAMALLAVTSAIMTSLLGDGGLMVDQVPDLSLLQALRYMLYFQHMILLPMWVFVVFRYFLLI